MTLPDKIKALPLPEPHLLGSETDDGLHHYTTDQMRALLDAAATLAAEHEPDMGHPKIQALIGKAARRDIELGIAEELLNDPAHEISGMDGDYWLPIHDKIVALQQAAAEHEARAQALADAWQKLYRRAINEANGLTNYVEDRPELRRAERNLTAIEAEARALRLQKESQ